MRNNKGFTLVELAVVLVIIGIILGAVLKGGDLIDNAKEKQFKSEISTLTTAYYNYLDKYGRLPGDDNKAATRWPVAGATPAATNGDNSGLIDVAAEKAAATGALDHLRRAGFLADQPVNTATNFTSQAYNGITMNFDSDATPTYFAKKSNVLAITGLSADDKVTYDTKYDDGVHNTGDVRSSDGNAYANQALWIRLR